jgi:hypothetical protein
MSMVDAELTNMVSYGTGIERKSGFLSTHHPPCEVWWMMLVYDTQMCGSLSLYAQLSTQQPKAQFHFPTISEKVHNPD